MQFKLSKQSAAKRLLTFSTAAMMLSSCASFKDIESGAPPHGAAHYAAKDSVLDGQGGQWPQPTWISAIGGTPLQLLVDEALRDNPGLAIAATRVAMARSMAEISAAAALPIANVSLDSSYQRFTENGLVPPPLAGQFQSNNQLALNFSYDFDFWGKHDAQLRSTLSQEKMTEAQLHSAQLMLTTAVARTWVQLARQSAQLVLTCQQQQLLAKIERLTQQRMAIGLDTESDLQQVHLQAAVLQMERTQWQEAIELTRNQLAALLGQGPDRGQQIAQPDLPNIASMVLPNQLPLTLLGRRPDITAARWQVEAAQGSIDAAKSQFYPNVNLLGFAGFSSLGLSNLLNGGSAIAGIGPAIHLPLFASTELRAQLKGNVAAYDGAVATYNQSLTEALHDVADQVQSMRSAEHLIQQQNIATKAAETTFRLAQQRVQVGTANRLELDAAEAQWIVQRKRALDVQALRIEVQLGLIRALGGGFDAAAKGLDPKTSPAQSTRPSLSESAS